MGTSWCCHSGRCHAAELQTWGQPKTAQPKTHLEHTSHYKKYKGKGHSALSEVRMVVPFGRDEGAGGGTGPERPRRDDGHAGVSVSICGSASSFAPMTCVFLCMFITIQCLSSKAKELDGEMLGIVVRILSFWSFNLKIYSHKHPLSPNSVLVSAQPWQLKYLYCRQ